VAFISAANSKKETHFDYNREDDAVEQWFSNLFNAPKTAADPFVLSKFFSIIGKLDFSA